MEERKTWNKILWAVDPFSDEKQLQVSAALAIQMLNQSNDIPIEPVYLFDESPLGIPTLLPNELISKTFIAAQECLNEIVSNANLTNVLPLKIISKSFMNQKEIADELIEYAKVTQSDLIALSTHAKSGIRRWFTGSFVENLMLYSDVPLYVVNPRWKSLDRIYHILFPTDFSEESKLAYYKVLNLAQSTHGDIIIYHHVSEIINQYVQDALTTYPTYSAAFEQEITEKRRLAEKLVELAQDLGIRAQIYFDYRLRDTTADAILSFSKKKHCIIALAAQSGKLSTSLLGSTTRKVIRGAIYPVWVIHPHYLEKKADREETAA